MAAILGMFAKLYRNTGTYGTPVWTLIGNCKDLSMNFTTGEADVTTRGNNGWRAMVPTLSEAEISFGMVLDTEDTNFTALQTAWLNRTSVEFAVATKAITEDGCRYFRALCCIFNFSENQNLEEAIGMDVTAKPTYSANPPAIVTVEA